jgi:CMP-N-acetylneuraminic acid synthetase
MRVLGLIPARGGSKGVPGKNIRLLGGKPLLQYTAEAALSAKLIARVILSTESEEIARVGSQCGLEVPFLRPASLAKDETPMLPVVQHAVQWIEDRGERFDAVCLLQPTNPMRRARDIDDCICLLEKTDADSVVTILPVPPEYNPHWVYFTDHSALLKLSTGEAQPITRRQDLPQAYHREGSVYVIRRDVLMNRHSLYGNRVAGHLINDELIVNIDGPRDWARAEALLKVISVRQST